MSQKGDDTDPLWGMSAEELAQLTDSRVTTARRWIRARSAPSMVIRCLSFLRDGDLGAISPQWAGWKLSMRDGLLYSPEGEKYTPGAVRAGPLYAETAGLLRGQLAAAEAALQQTKERRDRLHALADLANATAAAQAAAEALCADLTASERCDLYQLLDSTRAAVVRSSEHS